MKFTCDSRKRAQNIIAKRKAKENALKRWHPHFAWLPVELEDGTCRWLETVWRRGTPSTLEGVWLWEYDEYDP